MAIEFVQSHLEQANETEARVGVLKPDGGRRTLGGVCSSFLRSNASAYTRFAWWCLPSGILRVIAGEPCARKQASRRPVGVVALIMEWRVSSAAYCREFATGVRTSCGSFYCFATFAPEAIGEWIDENEGIGTAALCPKCVIDSVLGDAAGFPIEHALLARMRAHWFSS